MRMTQDPGAAAIVRTTIDLAHSLGLTMVAEGVETESALAELARLGCDLAQGYHISRPLPADQLTSWLQTRPHQQPAHPEVAPVLGRRSSPAPQQLGRVINRGTDAPPHWGASTAG
jgi:predicted signal transduction protein with EAL and GGDEF domain